MSDHPCQEPILDDGSTPFQQALAEKVTAVLPAWPCDMTADQYDAACVAAFAAVLAAAQVVDPEQALAEFKANHHNPIVANLNKQIAYDQDDYTRRLDYLRKQLAALRTARDGAKKELEWMAEEVARDSDYEQADQLIEGAKAALAALRGGESDG